MPLLKLGGIILHLLYSKMGELPLLNCRKLAKPFFSSKSNMKKSISKKFSSIKEFLIHWRLFWRSRAQFLYIRIFIALSFCWVRQEKKAFLTQFLDMDYIPILTRLSTCTWKMKKKIPQWKMYVHGNFLRYAFSEVSLIFCELSFRVRIIGGLAEKRCLLKKLRRKLSKGWSCGVLLKY